jgi:2-polyprenyl-3-methyl-5-hydroxy-6-metoxy-1,4-benzoquinol methylase
MSFERIEPGRAEWTAYYANHLHRYRFVADALGDLQDVRLLDAACGVGYGAQYLAERCRVPVVAVDRDAAALTIASNRFYHPSVTYCQDDCQTLAKCEPYAPFRAVISLETLEHIQDASAFLVKCRQMLSHDGVLLISTPNVRVSNSVSSYHLKEYSATEFVGLLSEVGFRDIRLFGQRLNMLGKLRSEIRADLSRLHFNPAIRFGRWLQSVLGRVQGTVVVLPETVDDFEIIPVESPSECDSLGSEGPFVLICLAHP